MEDHLVSPSRVSHRHDVGLAVRDDGDVRHEAGIEDGVGDLVDLAEERSLIAADEREMIHSVFELGDTIVREVMVPRTRRLCGATTGLTGCPCG